METIALHCRRAIMSWMCKDAHAVMFARNHNDSRLFRTRLSASIWISTRVSARLVFYAALQRCYSVWRESLKAPCTFGQRCAAEPAWKKTKFDGRLGAQSLPYVTLPRKTSLGDGFPAASFCVPGNLAQFAPVRRAADDQPEAECELRTVIQRFGAAHPSTFPFALTLSFRADRSQAPAP